MLKEEFPGTKFLLGPGLHRVAPGVEEVRGGGTQRLTLFVSHSARAHTGFGRHRTTSASASLMLCWLLWCSCVVFPTAGSENPHLGSDCLTTAANTTVGSALYSIWFHSAPA